MILWCVFDVLSTFYGVYLVEFLSTSGGSLRLGEEACCCCSYYMLLLSFWPGSA